MNELIRMINSLSAEDREEFMYFLEEELCDEDKDYNAIFESKIAKVSIEKEIYEDLLGDKKLIINIEIESKEDKDVYYEFDINDSSAWEELIKIKKELQN